MGADADAPSQGTCPRGLRAASDRRPPPRRHPAMAPPPPGALQGPPMPMDPRWHGDRQGPGMHAIEPLVEIPSPASGPRPADPLVTLLQQRFGIERFRDFQREAIDALLAERGRVLLVAPTGGGKSLC